MKERGGAERGDLNNRERFYSPYSKIVDEQTAIQQVQQWKSNGLKVVVADAVLDIPTYRHADFFITCANQRDKLLVRINQDEFVASRKDLRGPIVAWKERAKHAAHYPYIDLITLKTEGGWKWLEVFQPDVVVKSVTSGKEVSDEIEQLKPRLSELDITLVVLDQFANPVLLQETAEKVILYLVDKFSEDKFSGLKIRREIGRRAIVDYLASNPQQK